MLPIYNPDAIDPPEGDFVGECPSCGTPLNYDDETIIRDLDGAIIGCQYCTSRREAGEAFEKYEEE